MECTILIFSDRLFQSQGALLANAPSGVATTVGAWGLSVAWRTILKALKD